MPDSALRQDKRRGGAGARGAQDFSSETPRDAFPSASAISGERLTAALS